MFSVVFIVLFAAGVGSELIVVTYRPQKNDTNATATAAKKLWEYGDEAAWPGKKCQEGGFYQSPIDIRTIDIMIDYDESFIKHGLLSFRGYKNVLMTGVNNGFTIQFSTDGDRSMHPLLTGGPLSHFYRLEQMHFHWWSEHAVNGRKYPLEIHFVHVRSDLGVSGALHRKDGLAIVSVFCNIESWAIEREDDPLTDILDTIPLLQRKGNRVSGVMFNLQKIMETGRESFLSYAGSLTTPECNEAVIWIIYEKPLFISANHYRRFIQASDIKNNFRSLQPLRHQQVYKVRPASIWKKPMVADAVGGFFGQLKDVFTKLTRFVNREMLNKRS